MNDDATVGGAALAGEGECAPGDLFGGGFESGVPPDDGGVVAAKFHLQRNDAARADFLDGVAGGDGTGEGDGVDVFIARKSLRGGVVTGHEADGIRGQAGFAKGAHERFGNARGGGSGFPDDGVSVNEGGREFAEGNGNRIIPGADETNDTEGLAPEPAGGLAFWRGGERSALGHVLNICGGAANFLARVADGFAEIDRDLFREVILQAQQFLGDAV